ncbi:MAG: putative DNA-binding domain-containing protein [Rubrivivax sp.]
MSRSEAERQQLLLSVLWHEKPPQALPVRAAGAAAVARGVAAYRANAGAMAERALAQAYPVVQQLLGDEPFAALARTLWLREPPARGDLAQWGEALPAFVDDDPTLAELPYLATLAQLEWAVHLAGQAADAPAPDADALKALEAADLAATTLVLRPGAAVVDAAHPVATLWLAHQASPDGGERFAAASQALAEGRAEAAFVWRSGWRVAVAALAGPAEAAFTQALLQGLSLDAAFTRAEAAGPFDFEAWLLAMLARAVLLGTAPVPPRENTP